MQRIGARGFDDEAHHTTFKQRVLRFLTDQQSVVARMTSAKLSDAELAALGLTRARLQSLPKIIAAHAEVVRSATWSPPGRPVRALPAPSAVVRDLVPVGPTAFEYNPNAPAQSARQVTARLRQSGYNVTDTGGGILRLTGAGLNRASAADAGPPQHGSDRRSRPSSAVTTAQRSAARWLRFGRSPTPTDT